MIAAFEGKNFHQMVEGGLAKMASMGGAPAAGPATGGNTAPAAAKKEEKVEEAADVDMGGLFGGDDDYWSSWMVCTEWIYPLKNTESFNNRITPSSWLRARSNEWFVEWAPGDVLLLWGATALAQIE